MFRTRYKKTKLTREDISVLKFIQNNGFHNALIGGGAIRDAYFKKPIRDIDIYIRSDPALVKSSGINFYDTKEVYRVFKSNLETPKFIRGIYKKKNKDADEDHSGIDLEYLYMRSSIDFLVTLYVYGQTYDIIGVDMVPQKYIMEKFNVNISRCYCDGIKMTYPHGFLEDAKNQTITVDGDLSKIEYKRSMSKYMPKLKQKFPDFTIVDNLRAKYYKPKKK